MPIYPIFHGMKQVLLAEPESAKALFRSGQLNLRLKNIDAAKVCG